MLEALFWMAAGAALMHFFPKVLVGVYRAGKNIVDRLPF